MNRAIMKLIAIAGALAMVSACSSTRTQQSAGEVIDDSVLTSKVKLALVDDQGAPGQRRDAEGRGSADRVRGLDDGQGPLQRARALRRRSCDGA